MCSFNLIFSVSVNLLAPSLDTNVLQSEYVVIFDKLLGRIFSFSVFPTNLFQMPKAKLEDLFLLVILSEGEPAKIQTCQNLQRGQKSQNTCFTVPLRGSYSFNE